MLNGILTGAVVRRLIQQIPDARLVTYGGAWGRRVPDVDATHDELTEFDRNVATAANFLPPGAPNVAEPDFPTDLVANRAFKFKQTREFDEDDVIAVLRVSDSQGQSGIARLELLARVKRKIERNYIGLKIARGILCAGMATGELTAPEKFGWKNTPTDFGLPGNLKALAQAVWRNGGDVAQANSKPISDMAAMDYQASIYGSVDFDQADMSKANLLAMYASDEYKQAALASASFYNQSSLPIADSPLAKSLAERVLGKGINVVDTTYQYTDAAGNKQTGRYSAEEYVVLWRKEDEGRDANWDFGNVHISESGIALIAGDPAYGGDLVRGPATYNSCDRVSFSHMATNGVQQGVPRRHQQAVTAVIKTKV